MPEPMGFETDINKFVKYLETGLQNYEQGINYAAERPGKLVSFEILAEDGAVAEKMEVTPVVAPAPAKK